MTEYGLTVHAIYSTIMTGNWMTSLSKYNPTGRLYSVDWTRDWTRDWTVGLDSQKVALVISEGQKTGNCGTALYSCHRR